MTLIFAETFQEFYTQFTSGYGAIGKGFVALLGALFLQFLVKVALHRLHRLFKAKHKLWKDAFVQALYQPLSFFIWFYAIIYTINVISHTLFETHLFDKLPTVLSIGGVITASWFFLRWNHNVVVGMVEKSKRHEIVVDQGKVDAFGKVITILILFITVLVLMEVTGQNIQTLIAVGGVGGLAVAIASQEIIANFFGGLMIYITQPFSIGDWIHLPERNLEGHVEEIGWYMTQIRGFDKRPIYVPNSIFSKMVVITPSRMSHRQFKETIGLRYGDLPILPTVIKNLKSMLLHHPSIDKNMNLLVHFSSFGEYSLELTITAYTTTTDSEGYANVKQDLLFKIAEILEKDGAEMAQRSQTIDIPNGIVINQKINDK